MVSTNTLVPINGAIQAMSLEEVLGSFTDAELEIYKEMREIFDKKLNNDLWWYYDVGKRVAKIHRDADTNKELYGQHLVTRLARALGYASDSMLRAAMRVVDVYSNKEKFGAIVNMAGPDGQRLRWSHIAHLASVNDEMVRTTLAAAALEQSWTADQLLKEIQLRFTARQRRGGRPFRVPHSPVGCTTQMATMARKMVVMFDDVWMGKRFDLVKVVGELDDDHIDPRLSPAIDQAHAELDELAERIADAQQKLGKLSKRVRKQPETEDDNLVPLANRRTALPPSKPRRKKGSSKGRLRTKRQPA